GNYMLKVIANYNDQSATASDSFRVVEKSVSTAPVELDCDDNDVCTRDSIVEGRCAYDVISPCCGDDVCEGSEDFNSCSSDCEETVVVPSVPRDVELPPTIPSLERARELAERNPNSAVNYCNGLTNRDKCYAEIAKVAKSISYCEDISDEDDRDECYSDIADIKGDSDICKSVVSSATKDICFMNFVSDGDYTVCGELTLNYLKSSCIQMKRISELRP
ncbi:MAG: hypothetical protein QF824_01920, partial [Candidatus Woesearchaeota archaeon]|nr:hypothetical protein [Candidatus Woesearchaeota archaeon]